MPKVKGPLFSIGASGTLGNAITFKKGIEGQRVEKVPRPHDRRSAAQETHRTSFIRAASYWYSLNAVKRAYAAEKGTELRMTAYNFTIREYLLGHRIPGGIAGGTVYKISLDNTAHDTFGLAYPATYKFSIPAALANGKVYHRHDTGDEWGELTVKTPDDFFNGIEAARFDYDNNFAYVSAAFEFGNDIYIAVTDAFNEGQDIGFEEICEYYDARKAVVTWTADDWWLAEKVPHEAMCCAMRARNIWVSDGLGCGYSIYGDPFSAVDVQAQLDLGCLEVASHSMTHPWCPYGDYDSEIGGSRDQIFAKLVLPAHYRKGGTERLPLWIEPYGDWDATVGAKLGTYDYLCDRLYNYLSPGQGTGWAAWNVGWNHYNRIGFYFLVQDSYEHDLPTLKAGFDTVYAAGGIYHCMTHPQAVADWTDSGYFCLHLDWMKDKKDVWYVPFGAMYMYHYLEERGKVIVATV